MKPQGWGLQRERRNPETGEPEGLRHFVCQGVTDVIVLGPFNDEEWQGLIDFVTDPVGASERAAAREALLRPPPGPSQVAHPRPTS